MVKILIAGGTGLIGKHLCKRLQEKGYDVAILSRARNKKGTIPTYIWDLEKKEIEKEAINRADCIINLAGANIGEKRWTDKRMQLIIDSRIKTGELIFSKIKEQNKDLKTYISASAIGYYGTKTSDKIFTETDPPSKDFLGETCRRWEQTANKFQELGIRVVKIRTGVVLTSEGGALSKMIIPVRMGIGSAIGKGNQYLPWIHIDDLCKIYIKAIEDIEMEGAYNAVAQDHKTNKEFTQILARVLKKPFWFPNLPAIIIKLMLGKMSEILLSGSRISSDKIEAAEYNFLFPELEIALHNLLKK
ncbi:MAG: TIGR01777 family oxidoreductase [Melioribacteraceae bacterium]|nr:TIGR01777 family oxidoreductase [Melioribacteraceae bacterium]